MGLEQMERLGVSIDELEQVKEYLRLDSDDVVLQIKWNSILHIIRDCFDDVRMNNSRLFDADSALCLI